ncbi:hypothetical protein ACFUVV_31220 [Streptomyces sp. NPDC057376]|uniref:hypothetical protein n=1 Tax=Streptomyces sp. NPDC057376 TaxID=3346110 RepID=UPI0036438577
MADLVTRNAEMARRMYETQVRAHRTHSLVQPGILSYDDDFSEPWDLVLFSPKRGDWTVRITGPESFDGEPEFRMYWTGMPDFAITSYEVFPHEDGWVCRMVYTGHTRDGEEIVAHQVDFATIDDKGRLVRMEWYTDPNQWLRVWSAATGKTVAEVDEYFATTDGFARMIQETIASRKAGQGAQ